MFEDKTVEEILWLINVNMTMYQSGFNLEEPWKEQE